MISYTKLTRYMDNPARAYAHYVKKEPNVYGGDSDALVFGIMAHAQIAGEEPDLTDKQKKRLYIRGKEDNGLKAIFRPLTGAVSLANDILDKLSLTNLKFEYEANNGELAGRLDVLSDDAIVDWKFVSVRNWEHEYSERLHSYGDWINSTHYMTQALMYLTILNDPKIKHYYLVAINKSNLDYRVYDLIDVRENLEMIDELNAAYDQVLKYQNSDGKDLPMYDDGSDWYISHKKFEIVKPEIDGGL